MKPRSALILGGGFAGLSAAVHLALAGLEVTLLERQSEVGGKAGEVCGDGYRFDTGPSVLTLPRVLEEVFAAAGEALPVTLTPLSPLCRYRFASGRIWDVYDDAERTAAQLADKEARAYRRLLDEARKLYEGAAPTFVYGPPPDWRALFRYGLRRGLWAHPEKSLVRLVRRYGVRGELEPFYLRFATYAGADPYRAPAILHNIMWAEVGLGVYYPRGGIKRLARELASLAARLGVNILTDTLVERLHHERGQVKGVTTSRGEMKADVFVSALDIIHAHRLLGRAMPLERLEPSLSGFILLLGLEGTSPELRHHNILLPHDYEAEFQAIRKGRPAEDPTFYISISSKTDTEHAPVGHENLVVLVNAPALPERGFNWESEALAYAELLIDRLERRGLKIGRRIRFRRWLTPEDLAMTGWRGSIYGHAPHSLKLAIKPRLRVRGLKNLILAGGTVHPGGGIPLALLSGKGAAELALDTG